MSDNLKLITLGALAVMVWAYIASIFLMSP